MPKISKIKDTPIHEIINKNNIDIHIHLLYLLRKRILCTLTSLFVACVCCILKYKKLNVRTPTLETCSFDGRIKNKTLKVKNYESSKTDWKIDIKKVKIYKVLEQCMTYWRIIKKNE